MVSLFPNIGGDVKKNVQKLFGWTVLGVDEFGRAGTPERRWALCSRVLRREWVRAATARRRVMLK